MSTLEGVLQGEEPPTRRQYRREARFVMNPEALSTPLDGNQRAKILHRCEVMERQTKGRGQRNGILGVPAMMVLRALLMRFHNRKTGLCFPSYDAIQEVTGLCRQSIAVALQRLESAGVLKITRRLIRIAGALGGAICQQMSNLYAFAEPARQLDLGATTAPPRLRLPPRVYNADCNPNRGFSNKKNASLSEAFSPEAIQRRRAKAGLR